MRAVASTACSRAAVRARAGDGRPEEAMRSPPRRSAAVAVSSGSDALSLALLALGIGAGTRCCCRPSRSSPRRARSRGPVRCRCSATSTRTFIASDATMREAIERGFAGSGWCAIARAARSLAALMPVHLYGRACAMGGILELAHETGTFVIEDAAQAIDARSQGKAVGRFGDRGLLLVLSTKNLGGAGDGGLVPRGRRPRRRDRATA